MYSVSDDFRKAFRKTSRVDRVTGLIMLRDDTVIKITDDIIVRDKVSITRKVCGSKMEIGTFYAAELSMTIRYENAYEHNWGGAIVRLNYELRTAVAEDGTETWELVPLGLFYIDGQQTKRIHDTVTLYGYDAASKLDINPPTYTSGIDLWGAFCTTARRGFTGGILITEEEFKALPNGTITPDLSSTQLQSCRDVIMWIAHTVGGYALIDSQNRLTIKRYYCPSSADVDIISEATGYKFVRAAERTKIEFSDAETFLKYLTAYSAGETKTYTTSRDYTSQEGDKIAYGAINLSKNPLLQSLTADEQDTANKAYLANVSAPTSYIKSTGWVDPTIELLDVVGFSGGNVDISNGTLAGVVTAITWKYRNIGTITCASFDEYEPDAAAAAAVDGGDSTSSVATKSQLEKRIDGLEARLNSAGGTCDTAKRLQTSDTDGIAVETQTVGGRGCVVLRDNNGNSVFHARYGGDCIALEFDPEGDIFGATYQRAEAVFQVGRIFVSATYSGKKESHASGVDIQPEQITITVDNQQLQLNTNGLYLNGSRVLTEADITTSGETE